ncbi:15825_t:CDS:2 [Entrophospora sp. SA101]|nr:17388_t:CDS:2 [Entrophospora sp. SA101]CAJ0866866.1 15825_t:CDS:2 [Entrophospora sp. SA101]
MQLQRSLTAIYVNTINTFLKVRKHLLDFQITKSKNKFHSEDVSNKNNFTQKINKLQMPVRPNYSAPKLPIVLCHGLFGFDKLGPDAIPYLQIHYWGGVQEALKKLGAKVVTTKVPRTGCIRARALALHRILESTLHGFELNLLAHSMGGLDCRYLITHLPTDNCSIRSLTTIGTPHRGSPFMDWCRDNIGLGKLSKSFESAEKAVDDLLKELEERCHFCMNSFNKNTPNHPSIFYYSYGAATEIPIWSPLYFPYQIIREKEGQNDGLVSLKSAQWGRYVRTVECDHWDLTDSWRLKLNSLNQFDPVELYVEVATLLANEGH